MPATLQTAPRRRRIFGVPVVVALFFVTMMLPTSTSVVAGGLRLSPYRVILLIMFLPMLIQLLSGRCGRLTIFDGLVAAHSIWALMALIKWGGLQQGLESGGIYIAEFAGAWLVGRVYIRSFADFEAFARAYVAVVVGLLIFTLPEAVTGIHILHDGIAAVAGGPPAAYIDKRMGLERTFGPFDHPILCGVFSASAFSLAYFMVAKRRLTSLGGMFQTLGVGLATFISFSGGPYVVLIMQGFVAVWERALGGVVGRWRALFALFATVYIGIDLLSNRTPFHVFVQNFTFSAHSAYNRILIFEFGTAEVARHPFFGIGLGDWERPAWMSDSMDNFWLLVAVRYGLPALFFLVALMLGLIWMIGQRRNLPDHWKRARHAWAFTLFGITVAAGTVHLWNALFVLFVFLIGSGAWMLDGRPEGEAGATRPAPRRHPIPAAAPARLF